MPNSPQNKIDFPTEFEGIEVGAALSRLGNLQMVYLKLITDFTDKYSTTGQTIHQQLSDGDTKSAKREAHTIKGLAASIGAEELKRIASELETRIGCGESVATLSDELTQFNEALSHASEALKRLLGQVAP